MSGHFLREMADYCTFEGDIDHDEASFGHFRPELTCLTLPRCPFCTMSFDQGQVKVKVSDLS